MAKVKSGFFGERAIILPNPIIEELKQDPLGSMLHITDIGFYPKADFHHRSRTAEEAQQYILIYCTEGEGWFELEGKKELVPTDHYFILPKGRAHAYGAKPKNTWTIYWIHFDGEKAGFFSEGLNKAMRVSLEKNSRIENRIHLFEEIYATLKNGYSKNNLEYSITSLFHFLGSLKFLGAYRDSLSNKQNANNPIDEAIHFMRENSHKQITLKEIATHLQLSASHFSTLFQQKTGFSPIHYATQLKIQQACHHLDFSDMKVNQIAMMLGYDDPLYFSRIFTKTMGMAPSEYRKMEKG